jgi:glyoxylase-like metal-dependent hydrolase (beta-lactamase superfamily II)
MALPQKPFSPARKAQLIEGDKDLFADGSVVLISTPGHTPAINRCWSGCRRPARSC